jgi:hypothetical protein
MKAIIFGAFVLAAPASVLAQGTVIFTSYYEGSTSHFWAAGLAAPYLGLTGNGPEDTPAGTIDYAAAGMFLIGANGTGGKGGAATTFAQLLWANGANAPASSLVPGGQTTTFRTGNTVGRITLIIDTIAGLIPDSAAATFQMVAWDNSTGLYPTWTEASAAWVAGKIGAGMGNVFTLTAIGGSINTPPYTTLESFSIWFVPEPSAFAIMGFGAAVLGVSRHLKKPSQSSSGAVFAARVFHK